MVDGVSDFWLIAGNRYDFAIIYKALYKALSLHPILFLSDTKKLHFFEEVAPNHVMSPSTLLNIELAFDQVKAIKTS